MCIAAAERIYHIAELMPIHDRCKCTVAVVTEDHDPADELNKADLKQLYEDAGGTSAAHLKRTRYQVDEHGELGPDSCPSRSTSRRQETHTSRPAVLVARQPNRPLRKQDPAQVDRLSRRVACGPWPGRPRIATQRCPMAMMLRYDRQMLSP